MQYVSCRAWCFNNENDKFFKITDIAHKKQQYTSYCLFIVDETGLTVHQNKVLDSVAAKWKRSFASLTSVKRTWLGLCNCKCRGLLIRPTIVFRKNTVRWRWVALLGLLCYSYFGLGAALHFHPLFYELYGESQTWGHSCFMECMWSLQPHL